MTRMGAVASAFFEAIAAKIDKVHDRSVSATDMRAALVEAAADVEEVGGLLQTLRERVRLAERLLGERSQPPRSTDPWKAWR